MVCYIVLFIYLKFGAIPAVKRWYRVFPPAPSMANKIYLDKAKAEGKANRTETPDSSKEPVDYHLKAQFLANNHYETGVLGIPGSAMV